MIGRRVLALLSVAAVSVGAGCASVGSYETANTLGRGRFQFAIEPAFEAFTGGGDTVAAPRFDVAGRYGVGDRVDLSARVGASFLEFGAKFQLTPPAEEAVVVSIGPRIGGLVASSDGNTVGLVNATLPVLLGFGIGEGSQFVIGPKLLNIVVFGASSSSDGTLDVLLAGGTVGFSLKLGENFRMMPELGVVTPIVGHASSTNGGSLTTTDVIGAGAIYQVGVGFLFGGG